MGHAVDEGYDPVAAVVVVGFAAQLLFGALSYLIPSVLGGGPSVVRAAQAWLDRGALWRVTVVNLGLLVCLLPSPSTVRVAVSALVLVALVAFLPLLMRAIRAAVAARRALLVSVVDAEAAGARPTPAPVPPPRATSGAQLLTAVASLALVISLGVAADPASAGLALAPTARGASAGVADARAGVDPTGHTTRVRVEAHDMSYSPDTLTVPYGDRLVIDLVNLDDGSPHDLTFGDGIQTGRVMPGRSATLDVGVRRCQHAGVVPHHRPPADGHGRSTSSWRAPRRAPRVRTRRHPARPRHPTPRRPRPTSRRTPDAGFTAIPAALPPLGPSRTHAVTLTVEEAELEVAPGVRQKRWTFNGAVPGPTLHGRVGDTFVVTLVNHASMGHSVDFHAGETAPDEVMRTIPPGGSLTYRFTADRAGVWMYHCSTMPMSAHIAAGMHGAVVIEPDGLPAVDRSYLLVQSEVHLDGDGRTAVREVDAASAAADTPDALAFNGIANQYVARPLTARVGDRVRFWVLAAGPNRGSQLPRRGHPVRHGVVRGRLPAARRRWPDGWPRRRQPGARPRRRPGRVRRADATSARPLRLRHPRHGGCRARRPRHPGSDPVVRGRRGGRGCVAARSRPRAAPSRPAPRAAAPGARRRARGRAPARCRR